MTPEQNVLRLLTQITNDDQLTKGSPDYCGFLNCSYDSFRDKEDTIAYIEFVAHTHYYTCMMKALDLAVEDKPDLDETVFIKLSEQY